MGQKTLRKPRNKKKHKKVRNNIEFRVAREVPRVAVEDEPLLDEFLQEQGIGGEFEAAFRRLYEPAAHDTAEDLVESAQEPEEACAPVSKKKHRKLTRPSIYYLKASVRRPEVVEWVDTTAKDPYFLVTLKSTKHTVPVPKNWSSKRKFLHMKRGNDKMPFTLPDFIEATGISKLRAQMREREAGKLLKQRMRERMNPKLGRLDIDYQVLHDAFFKHQKKPKMTIHGDLYHEGKENELKMRVYKPGQLSDELKMALGMPDGCPPPWFINMQRFGPPPSYPHLRIPGLNMPAQDSLYSDPLNAIKNRFATLDEEYQRPHWGELIFEEEDEDSVDEEEEEQDTEAFIRNAANSGFIDLTPLMFQQTTMISEGYATPAPVNLSK